MDLMFLRVEGVNVKFKLRREKLIVQMKNKMKDGDCIEQG